MTLGITIALLVIVFDVAFILGALWANREKDIEHDMYKCEPMSHTERYLMDGERIES
jgi:hypothetical protein